MKSSDGLNFLKYINHNPLLKLMVILSIVIIPLILFLFIFGCLNMLQLGTGCFLRYGPQASSGQSQSTLETIVVNANGNYSSTDANGNPTSTTYGNWIISNTQVQKNDSIQITVNGMVSMCRAQLTSNSLYSNPKNSIGGSILLPKVEESSSASANYKADPKILDYGIPIQFPANQNRWLTLAQMEQNDNVQIFVYPQYTSNPASIFNVFTSPDLTTQNLKTTTANCSLNQSSYSAICGLYSFYSGSYAESCKYSSATYQPPTESYCTSGDYIGGQCCCKVRKCTSFGALGESCVYVDECRNSACLKYRTPPPQYDITYSINLSQTMPAAYDGNNAFAPLNTNGSTCKSPNVVSGSCCQGYGFDTTQCIGCNCWVAQTKNESLSGLVIDYPAATNTYGYDQCCNGYTGRYDTDTSDSKCTSDYYSGSTPFWLTGGNGLLYRISSSTSNSTAIGSSYSIIPSPNNTEKPIPIYSVNSYSSLTSEYLQFYFFDNNNTTNGSSSKNTGGVVLGVKQTKCVRINGKSLQDNSSGSLYTGGVQYAIIANSTDNPDLAASGMLAGDSNGSSNIRASSSGYLAFKITNISSQYINSTGQYTITLGANTTNTSANSLLNKLIQNLKTQTLNLGTKIVSNLICYKMANQSSCTNFFTYIKAMLSLYAIFYAMMFILGFVEISQYDLVVRLTKIALVAGLISGQTFTYFNTYIYPILANATDELIGNIGGYVPFTTTISDGSSGDHIKISNPMTFLDELFTKIFFSKTFFTQTLSLLGIGLSGVIYFYLLVTTIVVVIITLFKAILVYILSFMGLAIMISISPIVLSLWLFGFTSNIFTNWLHAIFRYIMDPVIIMVGIIILTQLFTIFLDYTLNFSVCWKCSLPLYLPFMGVDDILGGIFLHQPLFCLYWYGPWGIDMATYSINYQMSNFILLFMIAYVMYGYINIADEISSKLCIAASSSIELATQAFNSGSAFIAQQAGLDAKSLDKKIDNLNKG